MRLLRNCLAAAFFAALLILLAQPLVVGPEQDASVPAEAAAQTAALPEETACLAGAQFLPGTVPVRSAEIRQAAIPPGPPVIRAESDRNGVPLIARTWRRAAYASCPPESLFG